MLHALPLAHIIYLVVIIFLQFINDLNKMNLFKILEKKDIRKGVKK